jgi:hypothetical protein
MNKFSFEINIKASNQQEAEAKLKAASILMQKLKAHELTRIAEVVKSDPIKTTLAKKYLGL